MSQIVFNEISAAELSALPTLDQLALLDEFKVTPDLLKQPDGERFGSIQRDGSTLYRFRAGEYRIYFALAPGQVVVHRVLHANTFADFLFRSKLPLSEDEALAANPHFWKLIAEGQEARKLH